MALDETLSESRLVHRPPYCEGAAGKGVEGNGEPECLREWRGGSEGKGRLNGVWEGKGMRGESDLRAVI